MSFRSWFSGSSQQSIIGDQELLALQLATHEVSFEAQVGNLSLSIDLLQSIKDNMTCLQKLKYYIPSTTLKLLTLGFAGLTCYFVYLTAKSYNNGNSDGRAANSALSIFYGIGTWLNFKLNQKCGNTTQRPISFIEPSQGLETVLATARSIGIQNPETCSMNYLLDKFKKRQHEIELGILPEELRRLAG